MKLLVIGLFLGLSLFSLVASAATAIIYQDVYKDYVDFLDGRDPNDITHFSGELSRRDVVEVILMQQALKAGGYTESIDLLNQDIHYKRVLAQLAIGLQNTVMNSVWLHDVVTHRDQFYLSDIMIPKDKFVVGFYTLHNRVNDIKIEGVDDIGKYVAICNTNWPVDLAVLKSLDAKCVYSSTWESMVKMLEGERGDFILAPFQPTKELALTAYGVRLLPVKNVKVSLQAARVFIVSKQSEGSKEIFDALQRGIKKLKLKGVFEKAYTESGFYNNKVSDWKMIEPKSASKSKHEN